MKKILILLLTILIMSLFTTNGFTELPLRVVVNNTKVNFPDAQPYLDSNGRIQVPVRFVTEALGADVSWNGTSQIVTINRGNTTVTMKIGENVITVNGQRRTLDTKAVLKSKRTFVPVRFVSEAFGAKVTWENQIRTAYINIDKNVEIHQPKEEGETKYYSGIAFNPKTDISKDGRMKLDKAQEFLMKLLEQTTFYKKDGKYYMQATYPELPKGFEFGMGLTIQRNNNKPIIRLKTKSTIIKAQDIPYVGSFTKQLGDLKSVSEVDVLRLGASVDMINGFGDGGTKSEGSLLVHTLKFNEDEVTILLEISPFDSRYVKYDFKKLFKW
ncbi:MAG: copper amine oxidase N-terminal domain-containing protein [Clostridia bacterium]|nr:copper amine oxidase N-terminal domain-containing protein [Clostridia bacterium]